MQNYPGPGQPERHSGRPLPERRADLEQASALLQRGPFLEEEEELWCYGERGKWEKRFYQCRLQLAEMCVDDRHYDQAESLYSALLAENMQDETALCRLLALLFQQGLPHLARKRYEEVKAYLRKEELSLSPAVETFWQQLQKQQQTILTRSSIVDRSETGFPDNSSIQRSSVSMEKFEDFSGISVLNSPFTHDTFLLDEDTMISAITQEDSRMRLLLRRHVLLGMMALPFTFLREPIITDAEAYLAQCQEQINACWRLLHGKEIGTVQFLLYSWLPPLEQLLSKSSPYRHKIAHLAAQGYLLAGLATILQRQNDAAEWCRRQAVEYARLSGDINLQVAALKHLATYYHDLQCLLLTRHIYEEALRLTSQVTPLLQSRIELGLALTEARLGQHQKALHYWNLAQEHFPTYPEKDDPAFIYADCGKASFNHYGGLMYLEFGDAEKAWETFNAASDLPIPIPQRTTNEILLCQVQAGLALHDLDRTVNCLREGIQGAIELNSEMRRHDSRELYQQASMLWPNEHTVRELEDLFHEK